MRDSLFRLAQSVMQRQQIGETGRTEANTRQQHEMVVKEVNAGDRLVNGRGLLYILIE